MRSEARIEHRYPDALVFLHRHGPNALVIVHDLLLPARLRHDELVVETSVREIAGRLPFLSKDRSPPPPRPPPCSSPTRTTIGIEESVPSAELRPRPHRHRHLDGDRVTVVDLKDRFSC